MKENKIDFGKWTVPTKWEDVTLKQFSGIQSYIKEKNEESFNIKTVLHIFCNKTEDEVNNLPIQFAEELLAHLVFIQTTPNIAQPTNKIEISGETYIIDVQKKLKTGEYVAADSVMKQDPYNYPMILAILCRKEGEIYDSKFENEILEEREKMFQNIPMLEGMRLIAFFLKLSMIRGIISQLSMRVEEAINLTQKHIETSPKIGGFKRRYLKLQTKKLKKLMK